jgi:hypothetical protein
LEYFTGTDYRAGLCVNFRRQSNIKIETGQLWTGCGPRALVNAENLLTVSELSVFSGGNMINGTGLNKQFYADINYKNNKNFRMEHFLKNINYKRGNTYTKNLSSALNGSALL